MRCIWLLCFSLSLCAQTVNISNLGTGTVSLAGEWKFHPGDDPHWADPQFDDSGWKLVKVPLTLNVQGYPRFKGFGWYRLRVHWKERSRPSDLALGSIELRSVGEVFANGISIGRFGSFPPHSRVYLDRPVLFALDHSRWSSDNQLVLAIRIWKDPRSVVRIRSGLYESAPEIDLPAVIESRMDAAQYGLLKEYLPDGAICCIELALAIYLLALAFISIRKSEYLWFGLALCVHVVGTVLPWIAQSTFFLTWGQFYALLEPTTPLFFWFLVCGLWSTFGVEIGWTIRLFFACMFIVTIIAVVVIVQVGLWNFWEAPFNPLILLGATAHLIVLTFVLRHSSPQFGEARWLAISVGVFMLASLFALNQTGPGTHQWLSNILERIAFAASLLTFGYLLTRRFGRAQAEGERLHTEMRAAQEIQSLLLSSQAPSAFGFDIQTAYLPAQEVGGDFFQVATASDGSLLIAIGDVSGKGLRAALTVSLVVGLWKEITTDLFSPAEILMRLNRLLAGSLNGGYVTCLCACFALDGRLTVANAGHLAPYLNGSELTTQNGLPLGVIASSEHEESHHLLSPDDTLVFISDGVVEARDKNQNLFGFERLQQTLLERLRADAIARRAQQFGQEDDITVISISRQAAAEPALPAQAAASLTV